MRVVRLCSRKHPPLDGKGAELYGGRWNSPGRAVVYTASCGALAALEYLVHASTMPSDLKLFLVEIPDTLPFETMENWFPPDTAASRKVGDEWFDCGKSPILVVPSV